MLRGQELFASHLTFLRKGQSEHHCVAKSIKLTPIRPCRLSLSGWYGPSCDLFVVFPRRQASENDHFNVGVRLHRTFYRKLPDEQAWHFCRNCPSWPRAGYEERDNRNPPHEFCRGCIEMHHEETCDWANVELSPARSYRRSEIH